MNDNKILNEYKALVKFLGELLGENTEVVLHDLTNYENSIIAIENGYISGREEGDPLTDLALKFIKDKELSRKNYITNYNGKTKTGHNLRSSTYFIKNDEGKIIGMLCVNINTSDLMYAKKILNKLIYGNKEVDEKISIPDEKFTNSIEELVDSIISDVIKEIPVLPERMTAEEKKDIVKKLDERGVFLLKNAIPKIAEILKTSEATIYRYLNSK